MAGDRVGARPGTPSILARATNWSQRHLVKNRVRLRSTEDILTLRRWVARIDSVIGRIPADVRLVAETAAPVAASWIEVPAPASERVLLHLHGGGFVTGLPRAHAGLVARVCRLLHARGFVPKYRLAPEHPFPAAPADCLAAYEWLLAQGHRARDIVVCGDSAGGSLALTTLLQARDRGLPLPSCAVLLSASTDLSFSGASYQTNAAADPFVPDVESLRALAAVYLAGADPRDPLASPLHADFAGLPPLLFQVGDTEVLLDDSVAAAARATRSGVDSVIQIWRGMPHVFQALAFLPESREALAHIETFVRTRTAH